MNQILSSSTVLTGAAPWAAGEFVVADKPVMIKAFGLGPDDLVCVKMVRKVQNGNANVTATNCEIVLPSGELTVDREYLTDCGVKVCICAKQPWTVVSLSGDYEIEVSGTNVGNKLVTVEADIYFGDSLPNCAAQCKACEPAAVVAPPPPPPPPPAPPPPPVTATVTGLPCPLAAPFVWQGGTYASLGAFIADVRLQTAEANYNAATCTFTAPAGSVFPPLALTAVPVIPPTVTYCASMALPDGGFAFQAGDNVDPEATVSMLTCAGGATGFFLYPASGTSAAGIQHTTPVLVCGAVAGYAANRSNCAAEAPGEACCFDGVISGSVNIGSLPSVNIVEVPHVTSSSQNGTLITHFWSNGTTTTETADCGAWVATGQTRTILSQYQQEERNSCGQFQWANAVAPPAILSPSLALPNGGHAFQTGDAVDPLATVAVPLCGGGSMYLYPALGAGHTIAVEICGAVAGYAANETASSKSCTCEITVAGVVTVSGSVAISSMPTIIVQQASPATHVVNSFQYGNGFVTVYGDGSHTITALPADPCCGGSGGITAPVMATIADPMVTAGAVSFADDVVDIDTTAGAFAVTLAASSTATRRELHIQWVAGTTSPTITAAGGEFINGAASVVFPYAAPTVGYYNSMTFVPVVGGWRII